MKKMIFFFFLFLILFDFRAYAQNYIIGVSPSVIDLGRISRGSSRMVAFNVLTPSNSTILVNLESSEGMPEFFSLTNRKNYLLNYSEENPSSWVQPFSNPIELKPGAEEIIKGIRAWREVNFLLNIPENAEPGYHLIKITPRPYLPTTSLGQIGVQIATVTPVMLIFNVEGNAIREGKILDITVRTSGTNAEIQVHFLNTGTVTISARASKIEVYDKNHTLIATLSSGTKKVKPGEKVILSSFLPLSKIKDNELFVHARVDYLTDCTEKNSTVFIQPKIAAAVVKPAKPFVIPLWLIVLIFFVLISILVYKWFHED